MENQNITSIEKTALDLGADLCGIADIRAIKNEFLIEPKEIISDLDFAISLGIHLSDKVIDSIMNEPTILYSMHYRRVNSLLDEIATKLTGFLQKEGYSALPVPASQVIDFKKQLGHLDHRAVGSLAGLGWIGRSGLLVNPKFGARVRYATILTNAPLAPAKAAKEDCGKCRACITACPVRAIKEDKTDFDRDGCMSLLREFSKRPGIGQMICGVCVKACKPH
ncbi:MAG: hypothetical protein ABIH01_02195 [Candidatus Omnitrophota bacterium]